MSSPLHKQRRRTWSFDLGSSTPGCMLALTGSTARAVGIKPSCPDARPSALLVSPCAGGRGTLTPSTASTRFLKLVAPKLLERGRHSVRMRSSPMATMFY
ncbi:MAG: hypothetical protein H6872_13060 [Methylobacteriaceae bacterium]|nr:hypothetical protein [Methylobacteriaceae bacterium]